MIRSLNTAENAMQMQQLRIDALANNLANVNSTGFRGVLTRVSEQGSPETTANITEGEQAQGVDGALPGRRAGMPPTGSPCVPWSSTTPPTPGVGPFRPPGVTPMWRSWGGVSFPPDRSG